MTISGTFDPSVVSTRNTYGDGASVTTNAVSNSRQGTTGFTLSGVEDLGGGLKALFLIENNFNSADQSTLTIGQLYTGIEGAFGSVKLGTANSPTLTAQVLRPSTS